MPNPRTKHSSHTHTRAHAPSPCALLCPHTELQDMNGRERAQALQEAGLNAWQVEEVATFLSVLPTVTARVAFMDVDGEEDIMEREMALCKVGEGGCAVMRACACV